MAKVMSEKFGRKNEETVAWNYGKQGYQGRLETPRSLGMTLILGIVKKHMFQCLREIRQSLKTSGTEVSKTEILGLHASAENGFWVGGHFQVNNMSRGYHGILKKWWDITELSGRVLLVGESGNFGDDVKRRLRETYPKISEVLTTDLENADINWDISGEPKNIGERFDHIICQAVLEHVKDPVASVKNLAANVNEGGFLYVHSHGPNFPYHPHPIHCYCFYRDGIIALAELANLKIVDMLWTDSHWFLFLKKA